MPKRSMLLGTLLWASVGGAQVSGLEESTASGPTAPSAVEPACCTAPANTTVELEILDLLNSSQRKRGDRFGLRVAEPLVVDGITLIPAGIRGVGEVVHAAAARGGGAPGELLIAARWLDVDGQSLKLRGLKLGVTGGDNSGMALGVSFAAGPFAMFIRGREIEIPAGTRVNARLADDARLTPGPDQTALPASPTVTPNQE